MAHYKLYCVGGSGNSYKVALYLNCAGLDWEPVGLDYASWLTRDPAWRAEFNPMGEIPVLEVAGERMVQSGAILTWLAETTGHFAPAPEARYEALRWILFDNYRFTSACAPHRILKSFTPEVPHPALMDWLRQRLTNAFAIVDKHLGERAFMLGDAPTIADFSLAGYLYYPPEETGIDIATEFPAIDAWRRRLAALPGWKHPYALMAVGQSPPLVRR